MLALGLEVAAALCRGDASWDMRNYHIYNPFALLHKPWEVDLAPAHMQTFFSPTMDLVYYLLALAVPSTPVLNALVALPHAAALVLTFVLTCRLMSARTRTELVLAGVGVVPGGDRGRLRVHASDHDGRGAAGLRRAGRAAGADPGRRRAPARRPRVLAPG